MFPLFKGSCLIAFVKKRKMPVCFVFAQSSSWCQNIQMAHNKLYCHLSHDVDRNVLTAYCNLLLVFIRR